MELVNEAPDTNESQNANVKKPVSIEVEKEDKSAETSEKEAESSRQQMECDYGKDKSLEVVENAETELEQKIGQDSVLTTAEGDIASSGFSDTEKQEIQQGIDETLTHELTIDKETACKVDDLDDDNGSSNLPVKVCTDTNINSNSKTDSVCENHSNATADVETFLKETKPIETQINDVPNEEIPYLLFKTNSPPDFNDDKDITMNASVLDNIIENLDSSLDDNGTGNIISIAETSNLNLDPIVKSGEVTTVDISREEATEIIKNSETAEINTKEIVSEISHTVHERIDTQPAIEPIQTDLVTGQVIDTENSIIIEAKEPITGESSKDVDGEAKEEIPESSETPVESPQTLDAVTDVQPSTSKGTFPLQMEAISSEDVAEVTDSLGLLAESRVRDDRDSSGQDDSDGDGDAEGDGSGDGDYQDDENSNQMTIDQSEDSAQHSETDLPRPSDTTGQAEKDLQAENKEFNFSITNVVAGKKDLHTNDVNYVEVEVEELMEAGGEEVVPASELIGDQVEVEEVVEAGGEEVAPASELIGEQLDLEVVAESTVSDVVEVPVVLKVEHIDQLDVEVVAESTVSDVVEVPVELQSEHIDQLDVEVVAESTVNDVVEVTEKLPSKHIDQAATVTKTPRLPTPVDKAPTDHGVVDLDEISSEDDAEEERKVKEKEDTAGETATLTKITDTVASTPSQVGETAAKKATPPPTGVTEKGEKKREKSKSEVEVLSLDSDEETLSGNKVPPAAGQYRCMNRECPNVPGTSLFRPDSMARAHYKVRRRNARICRLCFDVVLMRAQSLIADVKDFKPLLSMDMGNFDSDLVEISDSSSDSDGENHADDSKIGILGAKLLEKELAGLLNDTWIKYRLEERLQEAQEEIDKQLKEIEEESAIVGAMVLECEQTTDAIRDELYAAFESTRKELPPLNIFDTPNNAFCYEKPPQTYENKRRLESSQESSAKRRATEPKEDDDKEEVSVVHLSGEVAPPSLPPAGEMVRPPLSVGMQVYAMRNAFGSWIKARVMEVMPKPPGAPANTFSNCKVKFENKTRTAYKNLSARCLAYNEPSAVRMTIGTRLIALFKDSNSKGQRVAYYSGVVAEVPNPVNKYRYLVFFDDGYAQYVQHSDTRLVCESSALVWEEVHPFSREFVKEYLLAYPERPMVRLHPGQNIKTEWNGKWWSCRVIAVDASLVQVYFSEDKRIEWIYRGSTRLAPLYLELRAGRKQAAILPRRLTNKNNLPYVEYTRSDEAESRAQPQQAAQTEELSLQRAVAKKSTAVVGGVGGLPTPRPAAFTNLDSVTSRVVYYTPKNAVRPKPMVPHTCGPQCQRTDVLELQELRTYNPLAKPLLSAWERQVVRFKGHKEVTYRAPCGRRLRNMRELHRYLRVTSSHMSVDLFDFSPLTHCLAEFVLNRCIVGKKDLSHGRENVPVPCVNYYDDSLPEFCSYNTERTPTTGVPLNLDPEFLCGCDCTDDCEDKSKCACWQLTLEGARTIGLGADVGYVYKRLPEPLPSGIYECNSRCKCKQTCLNRVVQHPLQLKLQVFKTLNRGWGIRALNDVPKGSFLCIYAGNLLTDAMANLDGLNEGDEYLAELDYIEVVEQMKEGYEEDVPDSDKKLDEQKDSESESESEESEEEPSRGRTDEDGDFQPSFTTPVAEFSKRLRKRDKKKQKAKEDEEKKDKEKDKEKDGNTEEDCITISDDEEVREPARFTAQAGPGGVDVPKIRSVRWYYGEDEACYIMDAKVQGNIGRYLNHSCSPNVFVQNVFVDTHDPRFPWVAFFALAHIRAGTELTWNYNYDVGSVPGKALYCYCGSQNCRGRLL